MITIKAEHLELKGIGEPANRIVREALAAALTADPQFQADYKRVMHEVLHEIVFGIQMWHQ